MSPDIVYADYRTAEPQATYMFPCNAMLARYMLWPCVRVSPSQAGVLSKQLNIVAQTMPYNSLGTVIFPMPKKF